MKPKREELALTIRVCTASGAIYLGLREHLKVARTDVRQNWPLVAVDLARDGRVIGIECVGAAGLKLDVILKQAGVTLPASVLRRAMIQPVPLEQAISA